jgi:hypothetical protein
MPSESVRRRYGDFVYSTEVETEEPLEHRYGDLVVLTPRGRLRAMRWGCALVPAGSALCYIGNAVGHEAYVGDVLGWSGTITVLLGIGALWDAGFSRSYIDGDL